MKVACYACAYERKDDIVLPANKFCNLFLILMLLLQQQHPAMLYTFIISFPPNIISTYKHPQDNLFDGSGRAAYTGLRLPVFFFVYFCFQAHRGGTKKFIEI